MPIISEKPLIEILSLEEQHDRFDINYYLPDFIHAERYLENCDIELTTLSDVMTDDASYGVLPPSSSYLEEGGISLVRSSNVSNSGIDYESAVRVPSEWINSERARIKSNDVLISIKGARAFFDMCVASDNPPDAIVNGSIYRFQCKGDYDPNFIVYWLLSNPVQNIVYRERANLGISYIPQDAIRAIPIPKLNIKDQFNILESLASIKQYISDCNKELWSVIDNIDKEINFDIETSFGVRNATKTSKKYRIVKVKLLEDRLDWKTYDPDLISNSKKLSSGFVCPTALHKIATIVDQYTNPEDLGEDYVKLIKVKWYGKGAELREVKDIDSISGPVCKVDAGDVVVSRIDSTQGAIAVIPPSLAGGVISKEFYCIRTNSFSPDLLVRILLHDRYRAFFMSAKTGATKRLRLDRETIFNIPIPVVESSIAEKLIKKRKVLVDIYSDAEIELNNTLFTVMADPIHLTSKVVEGILTNINKTKSAANQKINEALQ